MALAHVVANPMHPVLQDAEVALHGVGRRLLAAFSPFDVLFPLVVRRFVCSKSHGSRREQAALPNQRKSGPSARASEVESSL